MPYLIVSTDSHSYKVYQFLSKISLGRHPTNNIILDSADSETISRQHAVVERDKEGFTLLDCSLNGTCVNDNLIKEHRLAHGDQFQIANHVITFIDDAAVEKEPDSAPSPEDSSRFNLSYEKTVKVQRVTTVKAEMSAEKLRARLRSIGIIVADDKMLAVYKDIDAVSRINVPILILGEPGTGKEKVAQAIHEFAKAQGEFVAVNCSAIPETLFESELFGSTKGAFSDAQTKSGKLEMADNGTLFLDEVGDMGVGSQPKLLRFLECKSISRLGETRIRKLNIRVVAATNQDLKQMIEKQTFRADLFQRLACVKLNIPPLRKRKKDIMPLATFFLADYARQYDLKPLDISPQASKIMLAYHWPGNVRELANIMLNVCVRTRGRKIMPSHLTAASEEIGEFDIGYDPDFESLKDMEKKHIIKALKQTGNNKTRACAILDISRDTLYKKIQKYGI